MKTLKVIAFICGILFSFPLCAQDSIPAPSNIDKTSLGIGIGMDYGGLVGANLLVYPHPNIGIFGGAGYAIAGMGFNIGVKCRYISKNLDAKISPFAMAMYGYNAAIAVTNASQYDKLFYGPTFGLGFDYHSRPRGYWTLTLVIPIRGSNVDDYMDDLKKNHGVEFKNGLMPIGITFGYRFILN